MMLLMLSLVTGPMAEAAPHPSYEPITDDPSLPRVLLIGDSISMGYTLPVRELLAGKANVHRPATNCGPTSRGVAGIDTWLGDGEWDVIHFNFGLHDLRHMADGPREGLRQVSPEDYGANLEALVDRMEQTGATLIWCSTTPVPEGELTPKRTFGDVLIYNDIAAKIMKERGIAIDDLYSFALPKVGDIQRPHDVHFTEEGSEVLARQVAASIVKHAWGK